MYQSRLLQSDHTTRKHSLYVEDRPLTYAHFLRLAHVDDSFRDFFIALLFDAPFAAFRWETPPITAATLQRPFEFVLLDCPDLERTPDSTSFASHFDTVKDEDAVVAFASLGGDAHLVVPAPVAGFSAYAHLASFLRDGPPRQKHALLTTMAATVEARLSGKRLWLSTAGLGVPWLHVRIDARPKYYGYGPYRGEG